MLFEKCRKNVPAIKYTKRDALLEKLEKYTDTLLIF